MINLFNHIRPGDIFALVFLAAITIMAIRDLIKTLQEKPDPKAKWGDK